jgi:hypothetical protein
MDWNGCVSLASNKEHTEIFWALRIHGEQWVGANTWWRGLAGPRTPPAIHRDQRRRKEQQNNAIPKSFSLNVHVPCPCLPMSMGSVHVHVHVQCPSSMSNVQCPCPCESTIQCPMSGSNVHVQCLCPCPMSMPRCFDIHMNASSCPARLLLSNVYYISLPHLSVWLNARFNRNRLCFDDVWAFCHLGNLHRHPSTQTAWSSLWRLITFVLYSDKHFLLAKTTIVDCNNGWWQWSIDHQGKINPHTTCSWGILIHLLALTTTVQSFI